MAIYKLLETMVILIKENLSCNVLSIVWIYLQFQVLKTRFYGWYEFYSKFAEYQTSPSCKRP
jgi:hypothetical protein